MRHAKCLSVLTAQGFSVLSSEAVQEEKESCQPTAELQGASPDPSCLRLAENFRQVPGFLGPH